MIPVKVGSVTLPYVKHVQKSVSLARDAYISAAGRGAQEDTYDIRGYIIGHGTDFFVQQKALEDSLAALGETTVQIGSLATFNARVSNVEWEPYHTGPLLFYVIRVVPRAKVNPFAGLVVLGALTLNNPVPMVTEQYRTVGDDEKMSATASRTFRIQGRYMGDANEVQNFMDALEGEVTGSPSGYFAFTTPMGVYTAKAREFNVDRPEQLETQKAVTYNLVVETRADYSLETFNLAHQGLNVGGITFDVLNSFSHSIDRVQKGVSATYRIVSESISWSVKKYFSTVGAAEAFKPSFEALVNNRNVMTSPSGILLECKSVSYNVVTRDGYYTSGDRRYSITVSITFSKPSGQRENAGGTAFGIIFDEIASDSRGVSIDENGGITSRNRNVAGRVPSLPSSSLIGTSVQESDGVYYITGINYGKIDDDGRYEISVSGRTLETDTQCAAYIDEFFEGYHLDDVTNKSRSVSQSYNETSGVFETTSLSENISGYVWGQDAQGVLNLVTTAISLYGASKVTSASHGKREAFTHPVTKACTFKQSVNISRVVNYQTTEAPQEEEQPTEDPPQFDPSQPDRKEETTTQFSAQTDRFSPITIPGGNIVYKKIGVNPATARTRISYTAKNFRIFNSMAYPPRPAQPAGIPDAIETSDEQGEGGLTRWREVEWMAGSAQ